jgi:hypothetical protein
MVYCFYIRFGRISMNKFFSVFLFLCGILAVVVPLLSAQGHVDLLVLGDPSLPASSRFLREAGGHGNVTWVGLALMLGGTATYLTGAFMALVAFSRS